MARYIDADAMSIYFDALIKHAEMEGLYNMAHVYERCLRIVKDAPTADVAPRAEWISVEERMPDKSGQYLTWHGFYYGLHEYSVEKQGWNITYCEDRSTEIKTVTHWMPLPEPPKGDWYGNV